MKIRRRFFPFILSLLALVAQPAGAAIPGLYIGTQIGVGNVSNSGISESSMSGLINEAFGNGNFSITSFNQGTTSQHGFAGRVFLGYQIGYFWGIEGGWMKFTDLPVNATATGPDVVADVANVFSASTSGTFAVTAYDLVLKGIIPLQYCFTVYGKFGWAYMQGFANVNLTGYQTTPATTALTSHEQIVYSRFYPTFGVGVGYDLKKGIETDLSYTRIQSTGNSSELGSTDLAAIGLIFHFDV